MENTVAISTFYVGSVGICDTVYCHTFTRWTCEFPECGDTICYNHSAAHMSKHWSTMLIADLEDALATVERKPTMHIFGAIRDRFTEARDDQGGWFFVVFLILAAFGVFGQAAAG